MNEFNNDGRIVGFGNWICYWCDGSEEDGGFGHMWCSGVVQVTVAQWKVVMMVVVSWLRWLVAVNRWRKMVELVRWLSIGHKVEGT